MQTVAPSSIRLSFKTPGDFAAPTSASAVSQHRLTRAGSSAAASIASRRATTRMTLPSTIGVRQSKAIDAIDPAVYRPMPGNASRASVEEGTSPSWTSQIRTAAA